MYCINYFEIFVHISKRSVTVRKVSPALTQVSPDNAPPPPDSLYHHPVGCIGTYFQSDITMTASALSQTCMALTASALSPVCL